MKEHGVGLDELYQDLAARFGALGKLFVHLSSPKVAQEVFESLAAGDGQGFSQFVDRLDLPLVGKCFWLREIIERTVVTPTGMVEECRLRDDLTPAERALYFSIAFRHSHRTPLAKAMEVTLSPASDHRIIPPGPFLDELKANGLVTCETRMTYDTSTTLALGRPQRVCV